MGVIKRDTRSLDYGTKTVFACTEASRDCPSKEGLLRVPC